MRSSHNDIRCDVFHIRVCPRKPAAKFLHRHFETRRGVAAPAIFEGQITAERTIAVVAGQARHAARGGKMFKRSRRANLSRLWGAGSQPVAIGAG